MGAKAMDGPKASLKARMQGVKPSFWFRSEEVLAGHELKGAIKGASFERMRRRMGSAILRASTKALPPSRALLVSNFLPLLLLPPFLFIQVMDQIDPTLRQRFVRELFVGCAQRLADAPHNSLRSLHDGPPQGISHALGRPTGAYGGCSV